MCGNFLSDDRHATPFQIARVSSRDRPRVKMDKANKVLHYPIIDKIYTAANQLDTPLKFIPNYELYGEFLAGGLSEPIHHEKIRDRSSHHNWTIRLHRHRRLGQIFHFPTPGVTFRIGDVDHRTTGPMILVLPPDVAHGFFFPKDMSGDVVSLRLDELPPDIQAQFGALRRDTDMMFAQHQSQHFGDAANLIQQLAHSFHSISAGRADILMGQVRLILAYLLAGRAHANTLEPGPLPHPSGPHDRQIDHFCTLLEGHFQDPWSVGDYAQRLGVSAPHLTRLCRSNLGAPPNSLVVQRRLVEAKRLLEYTRLTLAEIAHRCGFRDAAFFSRTFKAKINITPHQYRMSVAPESPPAR